MHKRVLNEVVINNFILDNLNETEFQGNIRIGNAFLSIDSFHNVVDLWHCDDNSGRQKWIITKVSGDTYTIKISHGREDFKRYLGCPNKDDILYIYSYDNEFTQWNITEINNNIFSLTYVGKKFDKNEYELVVARYNENIDWTKPYNDILTVYNKGVPLGMENEIPLPNVGREGHTYLYHIVTNYDKLSQMTVFHQGGAPVKGYNGHHYCSIDIDFYLFNKSNVNMVITEKISLDFSKYYPRKGYYDKYYNPEEKDYPSMEPNTNKNDDGWLEPRDNIYMVKYVQKLIFAQYQTTHKFKDKRLQPDNDQFYTNYEFCSKFICKTLPVDFIYYAQGAQFGIRKNVILSKDVQYYKNICYLLAGCANPYASYYLEYYWPYMFVENPLSEYTFGNRTKCITNESSAGRCTMKLVNNA